MPYPGSIAPIVCPVVCVGTTNNAAKWTTGIQCVFVSTTNSSSSQLSSSLCISIIMYTVLTTTKIWPSKPCQTAAEATVAMSAFLTTTIACMCVS